MINPKRKGTLLFQFWRTLLLLVSIIALLKIHAHNTLEYRLLEDGYRMDILLRD